MFWKVSEQDKLWQWAVYTATPRNCSKKKPISRLFHKELPLYFAIAFNSNIFSTSEINRLISAGPLCQDWWGQEIFLSIFSHQVFHKVTSLLPVVFDLEGDNLKNKQNTHTNKKTNKQQKKHQTQTQTKTSQTPKYFINYILLNRKICN